MPAPRKFKAPTQEKVKTSDAATKELLLPTSLPDLPVPAMNAKGYSKEYLKDKFGRLSVRMMDWLTEGDRLETMLSETKLRDIGVMMGIVTDKVLLLEGQPTQIIGQAQHQSLDKLGIALKDALEKRGLVTLTERKVDIKLDGSGTSQPTPRT